MSVDQEQGGGEGQATANRRADLFWAFVGEVPLRDDREAMTLPMVSLSKKKRLEPIEWSSPDGSRTVRVTADASHGMATIWDMDVILWAVSQLNEAVERGGEVSRTLTFHPHAMLGSMGKDVGGDHTRDLEDALRRLMGTKIETQGRGAGRRRVEQFGLLDTWRHEVDEATGRSQGVTITVAEWIFQGVVRDREVLAISPTYFRIRSGIARWLYRLARRHAGKQETGWRWTFRHLHERSGSTQSYGDFARDLRKVIAANSLPEYALVELEGQRGDPVLSAVRDPARIELPQNRTLTRLEPS